MRGQNIEPINYIYYIPRNINKLDVNKAPPTFSSIFASVCTNCGVPKVQLKWF